VDLALAPRVGPLVEGRRGSAGVVVVEALAEFLK